MQTPHSSDRQKKSIYRNSWSIIAGHAIDEVRRGDLTGAERGAFHAGLFTCALGAADAAEANPYLLKLAAHTQTPGWILAHLAIEADSRPLLQSLIDTRLFDPVHEKVWSGYNNRDDEPSRDEFCPEHCVSTGASRCLEYLLQTAAPKGLLPHAVKSRHPKVFDLLLKQATNDGEPNAINQAFASLCQRPNNSFQMNMLSTEELATRLIRAGAQLDFDTPGPHPNSSWSGQSPAQLQRINAPALLLAEPGEELPPSALRDGTMDGSIFFNHWSSACLMARSAIEGGKAAPASRALAIIGPWGMARSPKGLLSPLSLMAMADPKTTDSNLRRDILDVGEIILASPDLDAALAELHPLSLIRCAVGSWLFGMSPKASGLCACPIQSMQSTPLIQGLAAACDRLSIRPLGPNGAMLAGQQFIERMRSFGKAGSFIRADAFYAAREQELLVLLGKEAQAAFHLAQFMPEEQAAMFLNAVSAAHALGQIADEGLRTCAKERALLSITLKTGPSRRLPTL